MSKKRPATLSSERDDDFDLKIFASKRRALHIPDADVAAAVDALSVGDVLTTKQFFDLFRDDSLTMLDVPLSSEEFSVVVFDLDDGTHLYVPRFWITKEGTAAVWNAALKSHPESVVHLEIKEQSKEVLNLALHIMGRENMGTLDAFLGKQDIGLLTQAGCLAFKYHLVQVENAIVTHLEIRTASIKDGYLAKVVELFAMNKRSLMKLAIAWLNRADVSKCVDKVPICFWGPVMEVVAEDKHNRHVTYTPMIFVKATDAYLDRLVYYYTKPPISESNSRSIQKISSWLDEPEGTITKRNAIRFFQTVARQITNAHLEEIS